MVVGSQKVATHVVILLLRCFGLAMRLICAWSNHSNTTNPWLCDTDGRPEHLAALAALAHWQPQMRHTKQMSLRQVSISHLSCTRPSSMPGERPVSWSLSRDDHSKQITLLGVIPTVAHYILKYVLIYILVFNLTFYQAFYLAFYWYSVWQSIWHILWHCIWHPTWHSVWDIFWHFIWHSSRHSICILSSIHLAFYLTYILTFYLAPYLTQFLAFYLKLTLFRISI